MDKILEILFHCDLSYAPNEELEERYSVASEDMELMAKSIKIELPPEHLASLKAYQEKIQQYQMLDCQLEFEKGFLLGAKITLEILTKRIIVSGIGDTMK